VIEVPLESGQMNHSIDLDQRIVEPVKCTDTRREVLVEASATGTPRTGGLELALARVGTSGLSLTTTNFRIVSIISGRSRVSIGPSVAEVGQHSYVSVPPGINAGFYQIGSDPLVTLDSMIIATL